MGVTTRAKKKANPSKNNSNNTGFLAGLTSLLSVSNLKSLLFDPSRGVYAAVALLLAEVVVNVVIIEKVNYTEIDWKAYMQEVRLKSERVYRFPVASHNFSRRTELS